MSRLTCTIMALNSARWIDKALDSVLGRGFDRVLVGLDTATTDDTQRIIESYMSRYPELDLTHCTVDLDVGYSPVINAVIEEADGDWNFRFDSDEVIEPHQIGEIRKLAIEGDRDGVDVWGIARRNWFDFARTRHDDAYPDWQYRLKRRHVKYTWRVHESFRGSRRTERVALDRLEIHHFNYAYRTAEDWAFVNARYKELMDKDIAEGRIP